MIAIKSYPDGRLIVSDNNQNWILFPDDVKTLREYLNQEVIAGLDNRKNMLENLEPERGAENWTEMKTLEKVIKLLRDGCGNK